MKARAALGLLAALLVTGCVRQDVRPGTFPPPRDDAGNKYTVFTTARQSTIELLEVSENDDGRVIEAHVEGCIPLGRSKGTFSPGYFRLVQKDGARGFPLMQGGTQRPILRTVPVAPGTCTQGWVAYQVSDATVPAALLVLPVPRAAWRVR